MTRITFVAFFLLTGFFYTTGKPVDENSAVTNRFADLTAQQVITGQAPVVSPAKLGITSRDLNSDAKSDGSAKLVRVSTRTGLPGLPTRNPRRIAKAAPDIAKVPSTSVKTAMLAKLKNRKTFGEASNRFAGNTVTPLSVSYQKRHVKTKNPVLGPRLTTILIKRELRRVGCYTGNVTSKWDTSTKTAIEHFNTGARARLATNAPNVRSLERIKLATKTVCINKPSRDKTILANSAAGLAKTAAVIKIRKWRTNTQFRKTAYRAAPPMTSPDNLVNPAYTDNANKPKVKRYKRRSKSRKYRSRRAKRLRIAKRKARRRTAVRAWRRHYKRKRFGFRSTGSSFSLD